MNKINIAELLKDCPKGMELDCTMYEDVYFDYVDELNMIHCYIQHETYRTSLTFNQHGTPNSNTKSKCVIFPKGKTTWEGFHRPFKDGDVITCSNGACAFTSIFKDKTTETCFQRYCSLTLDDNKFFAGIKYADYANPQFATEEEKEKLFQAIKDNGYKWNAETKTLEKLIEPKFKVGDVVKTIDKQYRYVITGITDTHYTLEEVEDKFKYTEPISEDKNWELVPNKFDITTLVPFESRVLVRGADGDLWKPAIYGFSHSKGCYVVGGVYWKQCIPYEVNKELLGTTNNPE